MEGSAIGRSVNGPMKINQSADPDGDGMLLAYPKDAGPMYGIADNTTQPDVTLGKDYWSPIDPKNKVSIKGGQSV